MSTAYTTDTQLTSLPDVIALHHRYSPPAACTQPVSQHIHKCPHHHNALSPTTNIQRNEAWHKLLLLLRHTHETIIIHACESVYLLPRREPQRTERTDPLAKRVMHCGDSVMTTLCCVIVRSIGARSNNEQRTTNNEQRTATAAHHKRSVTPANADGAARASETVFYSVLGTTIFRLKQHDVTVKTAVGTFYNSVH